MIARMKRPALLRQAGFLHACGERLSANGHHAIPSLRSKIRGTPFCGEFAFSRSGLPAESGPLTCCPADLLAHCLLGHLREPVGYVLSGAGVGLGACRCRHRGEASGVVEETGERGQQAIGNF